MSAGRRGEDDGDQEGGCHADQGDSAEKCVWSQAKRPRVLCRLCAPGSQTPDKANQAAVQRCPAAVAFALFLTPFVPGSIGGGAKRATASVPGVGKLASVLIET